MQSQLRHRAGLVFARGVAAGTLLCVVACSGPEADESTQRAREPVNGGSAFYYFRSNSTDWGVDEGSRLYPTPNPNVFQRSVSYALSYDDSASVTETVALAPDQWGTQQIYFFTPQQSTFSVPGSEPLPSGSSQVTFGVHYPSTGSYVVSFDASSGTLTIAAGTQDAGTDATADASPDATADAGADVTVDGGADASSDAAGDATVDASDAAADASTEAASDGSSSSDGGGVGTWQAVLNAAPEGVSDPVLLTDGRVALHVGENPDWWALTPDSTGSYVSGTWSQLASLPSGYAPLYYASAVLPDGRLVVEGGEYNISGTASDTNLGAIYDPVANTWASVAPPSAWANIGDAPSVVLASGTFMVSNPFNSLFQMALLDASTLTWTLTPPGGSIASTGENGWTLLPSGKVLMVQSDPDLVGQSGIYDPATQAWTDAGSTVVTLPTEGPEEIGPALLMPSGLVYAFGATSHTAVYNPATGTWTAGPDFPIVGGQQLAMSDAPSAVLPSGRALIATSPALDTAPSYFFEFDGATFRPVPQTPNAPNVGASFTNLLVLPTGQIMETDGSTDVEIYTAQGSPNPVWAPTITGVPSTVARGSTFLVQGTQFNGLTQGMSYGDDFQEATNYPLVRITNASTGHVFYARTHGHSTMGVATGGQIVSTSFDVPVAAESGASELAVVANGIASAPVAVTVQ